MKPVPEDEDDGLKLNYKLIYQMRHYRMESLSNREVSYINEAKEKARKEHDKVIDALADALGHTDFEFSSVICMAEGVGCHVYTPKTNEDVPSGVGKRKCVFCGLDDFDD